MATQRQASGGVDHFDLLPFIAILMCTLGCLLLVTLSVAGLSLGLQRAEGWIPVREDEHVTKAPVLVEWDGTTVTAHLEGHKIRARWRTPDAFQVHGDTLAPVGSDHYGPDFETLMGQLTSHRDSRYVLFAVRPSGFETFNALAYEFRAKEIDIGYEPIEQGRPVRLLETAPASHGGERMVRAGKRGGTG